MYRTRQLRSFDAACNGCTIKANASSEERMVANWIAASTANGLTLSCSSLIKREKSGMKSLLTCAIVLHFAKAPKFDAAALRTIGISSSHSFAKIPRRSSCEGPATFGYTVVNNEHAETRLAHPTFSANFLTSGIKYL